MGTIGSEEWIKNKFSIPNICVTEGECKQIFSCTYREYNEEKGATGGPGGMLHRQELILGNRLKGIRIDYVYRESNYRVPDEIWNEMLCINIATRNVIAGAGYIASNQVILDSIFKGNRPIMVCHDMGAAYGAYILGINYILIYHQQGSIINEILSYGGILSELDKELIKSIEMKVFSKASKVYFPSLGAKNEFLKTTESDCADFKLSEIPLYNTVEEIRYSKDFLEEEVENIFLDNRNKKFFLSISDYTYDKGVDRIPEFLAAYEKKTGERVYWILVGNAVNDEIYHLIMDNCKHYNIEAKLITNRISHESVIQLLRKVDFYIMLHRKSIFDLATLEAMQLGKKIILSDCESNKEFNVNKNIHIVNFMKNQEEEMPNRNKYDIWEKSNIKAYKEFFGNQIFAKRYAVAIKNLLMEEGMYKEYDSVINENLQLWKNKYIGKKCVICGAGSSLDVLNIKEKDCIYVALNKALFYEKIKFDILFMQDYPQNQKFELEDYNYYDCIKFYGIITNPYVPNEGLGRENTNYKKKRNVIVRYELAPNHYDYRCDEFIVDSEFEYIRDAQSVLFSALQILLYMGFSEIRLCGVDFSDVNYGNVDNKSVYAVNVVNNLIALKKEWKIKRPDIKLEFLKTKNEILLKEFKRIDMEGEDNEL